MKKINKNPKLIWVLRVLIILAVLTVLTPGICYLLVHNIGDSSYVYMELEDEINNLEKKDAVIVAGAAISQDMPNAIGRDRLDAAVKVYEQGAADLIIVSGGLVEEVNIMAEYLMEQGVPKEAMNIDPHGENTYESLARVAEKYNLDSYYFCTQEMYARRAAFLMKRIGIDGQVICVDTMCYTVSPKARVREFLAATKAVGETTIYGGKPKTSTKKADFGEVPEPEQLTEDDEHISIEDLETPEDCVVTDINENDRYDVEAAVAYARKYANTHNPDYPLFEQNCTNFVSQCLVAGGIAMDGKGKISETKKYNYIKNVSEWYSVARKNEKTGRMHYSTNTNFINTDSFINYFTEVRGYVYTIYNNDYEGKINCYNDIASGDVLMFYNDKNEIVHVGIVSGVGDMNAYYCANTNAKLDYGVFTVNDNVYPRIGLLHMSWSKNK